MHETQLTQPYGASDGAGATIARGEAGSAPATVALRMSYVPAAAVAVLAVVALGLALELAGARELWLDEMQSVVLARLPWPDKWRFIIGDNHPPLYFLALSVWSSMFGESPVAFRSLSAVMFAAGAVALFVVARDHFRDSRAAVLASCLYLVSPAVFHYSTEARMYTMALVWTIIAFGLTLRVDRGDVRWRTTACLGAACALAFFTHYVALFTVLGMLAGWALTRLGDRAQRTAILRTGVTFGALALPWVPVVLAQRGRRGALVAALEGSWSDPLALSYGSSPEAASAAGQLLSLGANAASILGAYPAGAAWQAALLATPVIILLVAALFALLRGERITWIAVIATLATITGTHLLGLGSRRYFLMLAPYAILTLLVGLSFLARAAPRVRWAAPALAAGLLALNLAGTARLFAVDHPRPIEHLVSALGRWYEPGDIIVFNALWGEVPFDYYADRAGFLAERRGFPVNVQDWWEQQPTKSWGSHVIYQRDLTEFVAGVEAAQPSSVWLVVFENAYYDPRLMLLQTFEQRGRFAMPCAFIPGIAPQSDTYRLYRLTTVPIDSCPE